MKSSQPNFNLRSPGSYFVCSYLITTVKNLDWCNQKDINKPKSHRKTTLKRFWFHFLTAVVQRRQAGDYCQNKVEYLRDSNSRKMVTQNQCSHLAIFFSWLALPRHLKNKWIERKLSRDANSSHFFFFYLTLALEQSIAGKPPTTTSPTIFYLT